MFKWKVEEMRLRNEKCKFIIGNTKIYSCENTTSKEDKIAFVDSMIDGKLSYSLSLIDKFNGDKDNLPKDAYGDIKTISLKAWINRNDKKYNRPIIDNHYHYGKYNILGCERFIQSVGKGMYDYYEDLVDEVFHRQLVKCEEEERKYFSEHDEQSILEKQINEKLNQYSTTFGADIWTGSSGVEIGDSDKKKEINY